MRKVLSPEKIETNAIQKINQYHVDVISEIESALQTNEWVVVGMSQNPFVIKARKFFAEKNIPFKYIEHGSYLSKWKERLAIKLWSGWPTFPQIFHNGKLIGGYNDLRSYLKM